MTELWRSESDAKIKAEILEAFFLQSNAKALIEIVRNEEDTELRKEALEYLSLMGTDEAVDFLLETLQQ